jgi:acetate kinase
LSHLGIAVDAARNRKRSQQPFHIQTAGSSVQVLVVPTDEELEIAEQTAACIEKR